MATLSKMLKFKISKSKLGKFALLCSLPFAHATTANAFKANFSTGNNGVAGATLATGITSALTGAPFSTEGLTIPAASSAETDDAALTRVTGIVYTFIGQTSGASKFSLKQKQDLLDSTLSPTDFAAKMKKFLDLNTAFKDAYSALVTTNGEGWVFPAASLKAEIPGLVTKLEALKTCLAEPTATQKIDNKIRLLNEIKEFSGTGTEEEIRFEYLCKQVFNVSQKEFDNFATESNALFKSTPLTLVNDLEDNLHQMEKEYMECQNELIDAINSTTTLPGFNGVTPKSYVSQIRKFKGAYLTKVTLLESFVDSGEFKLLVDKVKSASSAAIGTTRTEAEAVVTESERLLNDIYTAFPAIKLERPKKKATKVLTDECVKGNIFYKQILDESKLMDDVTKTDDVYTFTGMATTKATDVAAAALEIEKYLDNTVSVSGKLKLSGLGLTTFTKLTDLGAKAKALNVAAGKTLTTGQFYNEYRKGFKDFYGSINPAFEEAYSAKFTFKKELGVIADLGYEVDKDFKKFVELRNKIADLVNKIQKIVPDSDGLIVSLKDEILALKSHLNTPRTYSTTKLEVKTTTKSPIEELNELITVYVPPLEAAATAADATKFKGLKSAAKINLEKMDTVYGNLYTVEAALLGTKPTLAEYTLKSLDTLAYSSYGLFSTLLNDLVKDLETVTEFGHFTTAKTGIISKITEMEKIITDANTTYGITGSAFDNIKKSGEPLDILFQKGKSAITNMEGVYSLKQILKSLPSASVTCDAFKGSEAITAIPISSQTKDLQTLLEAAYTEFIGNLDSVVKTVNAVTTTATTTNAIKSDIDSLLLFCNGAADKLGFLDQVPSYNAAIEKFKELKTKITLVLTCFNSHSSPTAETLSALRGAMLDSHKDAVSAWVAIYEVKTIGTYAKPTTSLTAASAKEQESGKVPGKVTLKSIYDEVNTASNALVVRAKAIIFDQNGPTGADKQAILDNIAILTKTRAEGDFTTTIASIIPKMVDDIKLTPTTEIVANVTAKLEPKSTKRDFLIAVQALVKHLSEKWTLITNKFKIDDSTFVVKTFTLITDADLGEPASQDRVIVSVEKRTELYNLILGKLNSIHQILSGTNASTATLPSLVAGLLKEIDTANGVLSITSTELDSPTQRLKSATEITSAQGFYKTLVESLNDYVTKMYNGVTKPNDLKPMPNIAESNKPTENDQSITGKWKEYSTKIQEIVTDVWAFTGVETDKSKVDALVGKLGDPKDAPEIIKSIIDSLKNYKTTTTKDTLDLLKTELEKFVGKFNEEGNKIVKNGFTLVTLVNKPNDNIVIKSPPPNDSSASPTPSELDSKELAVREAAINTELTEIDNFVKGLTVNSGEPEVAPIRTKIAALKVLLKADDFNQDKKEMIERHLKTIGEIEKELGEFTLATGDQKVAKLKSLQKRTSEFVTKMGGELSRLCSPKSLGIGAIVGIVGGVAAVVIAAIIGAILFLKGKKTNPEDETKLTSESDTV